MFKFHAFNTVLSRLNLKDEETAVRFLLATSTLTKFLGKVLYSQKPNNRKEYPVLPGEMTLVPETRDG